jgi:hypothetical protein
LVLLFFIFIYRGVGFEVKILIRLILYIIYIAPIVSPFQPPPHPTQSNCKRFFGSVSYSHVKFINHIPSS